MDHHGVIDEAARKIAQSSMTIALTGAGISVDSGIPDFRSPGGLWDRFDPMDYAHIDSFRSDPERVWRMLREMKSVVHAARPNNGHLALAQLERLGRLQSIITQNIDNLHQDAGNTQVIEFHGNTSRLVCLACRRSYGKENALSDSLGDPPHCACGQILKPDVVLFGEEIPPDAFRRSMLLSEEAEVMIVAGTSAQVAPANMLPAIARSRGAAIVEVNLERTHLSTWANTLHLQGSTTEILPILAQRVTENLIGLA